LSIRRLRAIAAKEWLHIRRDPRSLAVVLVLPVVLLVLMGAGVSFDLTELPFAVCDYDGSRASRQLRETLVHTELFRLVGSCRNAEEGERLLDAGECLFVVVIPRGMQADLLAGRPVRLQMLLDGSDSNSASIARGYLDGALASYSSRMLGQAGKRLGLPDEATAPPVTIARKVLYNPALESRQFLVPGVLVIILVILGALLTSGTVVRERERGTFETLAASPLMAFEILLGKLIPYIGIGVADTITAVCVGALVFRVYIAGSVALFFACGLVFLMCAMHVGLLFSTIARTQQVAMTAAIVSTLIPSILLSGFVFPIRNMPIFLKVLANLLPATHFLVVTRSIYLKGVGLAVIWPSLVVLAVMAAAILGSSVKRFRKQL
jgi:ABC-2 type transport system permease protein